MDTLAVRTQLAMHFSSPIMVGLMIVGCIWLYDHWPRRRITKPLQIKIPNQRGLMEGSHFSYN